MKNTRIGLLILSVLLCVALGVAFTACDSGDTPTDTTVADTPAPTDAPTEDPTDPETTEEPTEVPTEAPTEPEETEPPIVDVMVGETLDAPHATQFTVSNVFANDMVVQRNEHIRVWGWADASQNGKKVTGEFKGMFAEAIIEDGAWEITFGARMEASAELGHTMKIYGDGVSCLVILPQFLTF